MPKIAILILAAGTSSRMGEPKQLLSFGNTTLLGSTIQSALKSYVDTVYCVLGAYADLIQKVTDKHPVKVIINDNYESGLSSSIVAGMAHLNDYDAVLILLADQPKVNTTYLNELLATYKSNPTKIIGSNYNGRVGVPAIFPKVFYPDLLQLKGDKGARNFLHNNEHVIVLDTGNLIDIDTKEAYSKFLESRK